MIENRRTSTPGRSFGLPDSRASRRAAPALRAIALIAGAAVCGTAPAADSLGRALEQATGLVDWRLRQESVDQDGFASDADAITSRLRAGFETAPLGATRLLVEAVGVAAVRDDYNSTTNGNTAFPTVADPSGFAAVNRFALTNESLANATWTIGRQRIIHDDARFVGNVGWRQNEQTYDAVRMQYAGRALEADVAYASQINRIFGPDSPAGRWSGDVIMTRLAYPLGPGTLTGFHYLLELDAAPGLSTRTTGLRFAGMRPAGGFDVTYVVSAARQADAGANPATFAETYLMGEAGIERDKLRAALGYEQLGGNGASAVTTPLATLHAFQGWADRFLATPASGIRDRYVRFGYALGSAGPFTRLDLTAVHHRFDADAGSADLGRETDLSFVARAGQFALTLKHARYTADPPLADTSKTWLSLDYSW